jgi:hypothetical protein
MIADTHPQSTNRVTNIEFKNKLSYFKEDEIFSCFQFARNNRVLLGTQKGTILLGKVITKPEAGI